MTLTQNIKIENKDSESERVLFVCTGNTCRSPMAAAVVNHYGQNRGITAESAGVSAIDGDPISVNSVNALRSAGIEPSGTNRYDTHTARRVTEALLENADRVVAMTGRHMLMLTMAFPQYATRIECMPNDISDPFGGDEDDYAACLAEITEGVSRLFALPT